MMSDSQLRHFGAYRKALELFDFVAADLAPLEQRSSLSRLVGQQYASADSVAANIEEGYGRGSPKEYAHFLVIARGSAQETRGRYGRLRHWLSGSTIEERQRHCDEIIAILTKSIETLRRSG